MAPKRTSRDAVNGPRSESQRASVLRLLPLLILGFLTYCMSAWVPRRGVRSAANTASPAGAFEGFEKRDLNVGWIFGIVGILAVSGLGIHLLLGGYLRHLNGKEAPGDNWQPVARPAGGLVSPVGVFPHLQVSPPFDLAGFRAREDERLNSYGWINRTSGTVHIPISAAMELLLKRGLPVRQGGDRGPSSYELQLQRVQNQPLKQEEYR